MPQQIISAVKSLSLPIKFSTKKTLDRPIKDFRMGGSLNNINNDNVKSFKIVTQSYKRTLQSENNEKIGELKVDHTTENENQEKHFFKNFFNFLLSSPISFKLLVLQFIWILPYLMLTNYLERSLLPFRLLCYTESDLLSVQKPYRQDLNQCIKQFFPNRHKDTSECTLNHTLQTLINPKFDRSSQNVIVIRSAQTSIDYRNYIRETWKKNTEPKIPIIFVCGNNGNFDLSTENETYGDILQLDFVDSYKNLTRKMMGIYDYFLKNSKVSEIIVINDDTIVNATALNEITNKRFDNPVMIGKVSRGYPRLFFNWLPWYVSSEDYPNKCYPPFVQGSSFIINRSAASLIHKNICKFPFVHLDDVFMGIITNCLGIHNHHEEGFDHHVLDKFVVFHYQYIRYSATQLMHFWNKIKKEL
uniref:Hexosyltransferase n=1 Tax=Strongyloides papillosus TaxID=174720 RepID=A0A0N5BAR9_STREA